MGGVCEATAIKPMGVAQKGKHIKKSRKALFSYIVYRLNSGRESYIANGGKLGRKKGSIKTTEQK